MEYKQKMLESRLGSVYFDEKQLIWDSNSYLQYVSSFFIFYIQHHQYFAAQRPQEALPIV